MFHFFQEYEKKPVDYWLIANSYSPRWGMHGLFKIRRGSNECGIESTPAAGTPDLKAVFVQRLGWRISPVSKWFITMLSKSPK